MIFISADKQQVTIPDDTFTGAIKPVVLTYEKGHRNKKNHPLTCLVVYKDLEMLP